MHQTRKAYKGKCAYGESIVCDSRKGGDEGLRDDKKGGRKIGWRAEGRKGGMEEWKKVKYEGMRELR